MIKSMFGIVVAAGLVAAMPCKADPSIAGEALMTSSHGQPFCTSRGQLTAVLSASVSHAKLPYAAYNTCVAIPDGANVIVLQDVTPRSRYMHVVLARVATTFGSIDAYTYSVGLYPHYSSSLPPISYNPLLAF